MSRLILLLLFAFFFSLINVQYASAHVGGGPPFLQVDAEYAVTNPYFLGSEQIDVPQDTITHHYLVNQPINFAVDTSKLLVPPDIAAASTFRWTFGTDSKKRLGPKQKYTFHKQGSYLITMEVKAPGQSD